MNQFFSDLSDALWRQTFYFILKYKAEVQIYMADMFNCLPF